MSKRKNPTAVKLGKKGGMKRVPKGFAKMDPERRREIAKKAAAKSAKVRRKKAEERKP